MTLWDRIRARAARLKGDSALYDLHPELRLREHLLTISSDEQAAPEQAGYRVAANDYGCHVWTQRAVRILADNIAPLPVRVVDRNDEPLDAHPLAELFAYVNDTMSPPDLWRQWTTDMMLGGESGFELVRGSRGGWTEIWPRQPTQFNVIADKARRRYYGVSGYRVKFDSLDEGFVLPPEEFVHFKFYNPANPWRGLAPITAVRMGIVIDQLAQIWSRLFFKHGTRPDYALIAPQGMTLSERESLATMLAVKFGGAENWHKPIVLEEGVTDIKTFSYPPKDTEWLEQRKLAREEIAAIFGVPDEMMGYGRNTYENYGESRMVLWTLTLVPLIGHRDSSLTEFFQRIGMLRPGERIDTDVSEISELQDDLSGKSETAVRLFSLGVPFNQIDDRLAMGIGEIPGGDEPFGGREFMPTGMGGGPGKDAQGLWTEPTRAPVEETKDAIPVYGSEAHQVILQRAADRQEPITVRMQRKLKKQFQRQQVEVGQRVRDSENLGRAFYLRHERKDLADAIRDIFPLDEEVAQFIEEFGPEVEEMFIEAGNEELDFLGIAGPLAIDRPEVQAAIREVLEAMAERTNETTYNDLIDLFQEAEREGESIQQIMERLSAYFGGRKSDYETERIARTTMVGADSAGSLEGYRQSGVVDEKAWISALAPGRTRPEHAEAHGQQRKVDEAFLVGGEQLRYPGDPQGSPGNIINCLCAVIPIVK